MDQIDRPDRSDYADFYAGYVARVPDGDIVGYLQSEWLEIADLLSSIPEDQQGFRYAADKWSIREILGHLIDAERVFVFRALTFARGGTTPLPGFDEQSYAATASSDSVPFEDLFAELEVLRRGTVFFFRGLPLEAWARRGTANDAEVSVRALAWIIAGHMRHHMNTITERYLPAMQQ